MSRHGRMAIAALATIAVWTAGLSSQAPSQATGGSISGRVVDGSTDTPLTGAVVVLATGGTTAGSRRIDDSQTTDRSGRFLFSGLSSARTYEVLASKPGYFDGALGADAVLTTPRRVTLADDQWLRDVTIPLWKPSAISGTILDETGAPAVGVHVAVVQRMLMSGVPQFAAGRLTRTDDRGLYRIAPLTAGTYAVMVPSIRFSVPNELPSPPAVTGPQTMSDLAEALGVVDGQLVRTLLSPRPQLGPAQHALPFEDGNYLVLGAGSLPPPPPRADGRRQAYHTRFYPASDSLRDAGFIDLGHGETRAGLDVQLRPVPVSRVLGIVEGPTVASLPRQLRLMVQGDEQMGPGHEVATAFTTASGSFTFLDVPDGEYSIVTGRHFSSAAPRSSGAVAMSLAELATLTGTVMSSDRFFAETPVSIAGADQRDVLVRLRAPLSITGRILIDTPEDRTTLTIRATALQVVAEPAVRAGSSFNPMRASVPLTAQALDFTIGNLLPGEYVLRMAADNGVVKSIVWNGKNYTGIPIAVADDIAGVTITVTAQSAIARGTVRTVDGKSAREAVVMYFPDDRSRWQRYGPQPDRLRSVPVRFGEYEVPKMPAGTYFLVAVHEGLADRWRDPAFLEAASRVATRVTIGWGETRTQDLTVVEVPR